MQTSFLLIITALYTQRHTLFGVYLQIESARPMWQRFSRTTGYGYR